MHETELNWLAKPGSTAPMIPRHLPAKPET